ncbi:MAG: GDSL-type esterase/lipase family protein [bacterium]
MKILLVGSSIFQAWFNVAEAVPEHELVNRAIGGTITEYWRDNLQSVMDEENPDVVMMYCGSNDICMDVPAEEIVNNIKICRSMISNFNPAIRFAYFSIIKAPQKEGKWELIDQLSEDIKMLLYDGDLFVELNEIFFVDNSPVDEFFVEDRLHLTDEAYEKMVVLSKPLLKVWL